jgi:hypothetical protein
MNLTSFVGSVVVTLAMANCPPNSNQTQGILVTHLPEQRVLPNGQANDLSVSQSGTTKRIRIQIDPRGNTLEDSEVTVSFSLNQHTNVAMQNTQQLVATRRNGTPTTLSVFTVDIPGSRQLDRCGWFHYRWAVRYHLPGQTTLQGSYFSQVKSFQIFSRVAPGSDVDEGPPCPPVP